MAAIKKKARPARKGPTALFEIKESDVMKKLGRIEGNIANIKSKVDLMFEVMTRFAPAEVMEKYPDFKARVDKVVMA